MVYILNSSFPLNPILISTFHHPNLSKTPNVVLCKDVAKNCQENFILICISPLLYLMLKKLLYDPPKKNSFNKMCIIQGVLFIAVWSTAKRAAQSVATHSKPSSMVLRKLSFSSFIQHDVYLTVQENEMLLRSVAFSMLIIPSICFAYTLNEHE
jgi:ABC-type transport system involved in cytochrome c biogenesis permease component